MTDGDTFSSEQMLYIFRVPVILIVTVIAAIILATSVPNIQEGLVRADTLAASIAYDNQLFTTPGVISEQSWQAYNFEPINYQNAQINTLPAGRITLNVDELEQQVKYTNREHWRAYEVQGAVAGIVSYDVKLPITYKNGEETLLGELLIEVLVRE